MYSANIFDVAQRNNLWNPINGNLDFLRVYAPERGHSPYATRCDMPKMQYIYMIVNPSCFD